MLIEVKVFLLIYQKKEIGIKFQIKLFIIQKIIMNIKLNLLLLIFVNNIIYLVFTFKTIGLSMTLPIVDENL